MKKHILTITLVFSIILVYGQNVGIGTDTPDEKLHVVGGAIISSLGGNGNALVLSDSNGVLSIIPLSGSPSDVFNGTGVFAPIAASDNDWQVIGNDIYSIQTGNVGIGITAPMFKFHAETTSTGAPVGYFSQNSTDPGSHAVKGEGPFGPTRGYLGIQGATSFDSTSWDIDGQEIGVLGISDESSDATDNVGVMGLSNGMGVVGQSTMNHGVYAETASSTNFGISVSNTDVSGTAVYGSGNNIVGTYLAEGSGGAFTGTTKGALGVANDPSGGTGLLGVSNNGPLNSITIGSGVHGSSDIYGVTGASASTAFGVTRAGGYFETGSAQSYAYVGMRTSSGTNRKIEGNGTVNTTVKDTNGELVVLSCPEAPENFFQDYGQGKLENGKAHITLDPILTKNIVVDDTHPLRVFVQLEGDCKGVYVTNKTERGFDVIELSGGSSNVDFSWTITANRADEVLEDGTIARYSSERFAPAQGPLSIVINNTAQGKPPFK